MRSHEKALWTGESLGYGSPVVVLSLAILASGLLMMILPLMRIDAPRPGELYQVRSVSIVRPSPQPPVFESRDVSAEQTAVPDLVPLMPLAPRAIEIVPIAMPLPSMSSPVMAIDAGIEFGIADESWRTGVVLDLHEVDEKPVPISRQPPRYPASLEGSGVSGTVSVLMIVDEKGGVVEPRIERPAHPLLNQAAVEAVKTWRFRPARSGGIPVRLRLRQTFQFDQ